MKQFYLTLTMVLAFAGSLLAQTTVTGTVTDASGEALISANVVVKGTTTGTVTDLDGKYSLTVPEGATTLVFSYTGYDSKDVEITGSVVDVVLTEGLTLETAVVTALGVKREDKSVGYAVQKLDGDNFTQVKEANVVNALNGKIAGVHINSSSGAVGASTRITLRGVSSLTGNNQPLFVVDGVPIDNANYGNAGSSGGFDMPNGVADLNQDDIETITVLKGPNAAALYGVRASNGVIVITTKSGKGTKGLGISFNSSSTFSTPLVLPDFQNSYGQGNSKDYFEFVDGATGSGGVDESWGPALDKGLNFVQWDNYKYDGAATPWVSQPDNIKDFYDVGQVLNNSLSFVGGNDVASFRLSMAARNEKGIIPNTEYNQYNVGGNSSLKIADKLTAQVSVNYSKSLSGNLPTGGYNNENPVQQMIWGGRNVDFNALRDYKNLPMADPSTPAAGTPLNWNTQYQNNPFWVLDNNLNQLNKDRVIGNVSLTYDVTDKITLRTKVGADTWSSFVTQQKAKGSNENPEGYYSEISRTYQEINSEVLASYNTKLTEDFDFQFNVGANRMDRKYRRVYGEAEQLELPGLYNLSNVKSGVTPLMGGNRSEQRINSVFAFGQIGYKNAIYLDFTARNDWASILPTDNNSFFYPSVSLSAVVSELVEMPKNFSYLKVRAGWSKVGGAGALSPYQLEQTYGIRSSPWGSVILINNPASLNNPNLVSETTTGTEFGFEMRLFGNRVKLDYTYYNQLSSDLIVPVEVSGASGYTSALLNVGEMRNAGHELTLGLVPYRTKDWEVGIDVNFAKNTNTVESLGELDALTLGGQWNMDLIAEVGQPYGVIKGPAYQRTADGQIIYTNGVPTTTAEDQILGSIQPDWTGGITFNVSWKSLSLGTTFDAKIGGEIHSMTYTWGRYAGVLEETLIGRETGIIGQGVMNVGTDENPQYVPNNVVVPAKTFNQSAFSNSFVDGAVFDASYVKWRQMVLTYKLPKTWFGKTVFKGASVSVVGRNLAILHRNTPHIDPETGFSSSNGEQGQEFGQLPSTRSFGFNLNLNF